jgi:hypothetical protein
MDRDRERSPRCLGCLNFTGFSPLNPPEGFDPDQEEEHVFTCHAFPGGIPEEVLSHRQHHSRRLPGQEGDHLYRPREPASLSVAAAAELIGCSAATVRRYLKGGLIWGVKRGREWFICQEEVRLLRRPGARRRTVPPGFFRPA